jgi:hypothetical protein
MHLLVLQEVHYVAALLSIRGMIALPTIRNTPGIDLVVINPAGHWNANIQVKTSRHKVNFWPISSKYHDFSGQNNDYAFVRYIASSAYFEVFIEKADTVITDVDLLLPIGKAKGLKEWASSWYLPRDPIELKRIQEQYDKFGRSF